MWSLKPCHGSSYEINIRHFYLQEKKGPSWSNEKYLWTREIWFYFHSHSNICWLLNIFRIWSIDKRESWAFLTQSIQVHKAKHTTTSSLISKKEEMWNFFEGKLVNNQTMKELWKLRRSVNMAALCDLFLWGPCWEQLDLWGDICQILGRYT